MWGRSVSCDEDVRELPDVASSALSISEFNADVRFSPVWLNISHALLSGKSVNRVKTEIWKRIHSTTGSYASELHY